MITMNGTVKLRGRKLPIYWTGEFAQHLAERHKARPSTHPFLHIEAQKLLQKCIEFRKQGKSYIGIIIVEEKEVYIIFFVKANFAIIKTCYIYGS